MLSFTEQETPNLEASSEERQKMAIRLGSDFYEIHLLLKLYENELDKRLGKDILQDSTDESSGSDQNIVH
jgi:hypothetical protein